MIWLVDSLAGFCIAVAAHAILARLAGSRDSVIRFVAIAIVVAAALGVTVHGRSDAVSAIAAVAVFVLLGELYLFAFTLSLASISANILIHVARDRLDLPALQCKYDHAQMIELRIRRMVESSLIETREGGLAVTPKGRLLAAAFGRLSSFVARR